MKGVIIGGKFCTGKSSVAQILSKKIKADLLEVSKRIGPEDCLNSNDADLICDNQAIQKISQNIKEKKNIIVVGRYPALWSYFDDKNFLKVLIYAENKTVVFRHMDQGLNGKRRKSEISDTFHKIKIINECDSIKSQKLYGKDCFHKQHYDAMINSTSYSPEEVADIIIMMHDMIITKNQG